MINGASWVVLVGKEPACQCRRHKRCGFNSWVRKIPWRRAWQPTPVVLPGESDGQRNLAGYSPWGHKELDTAEHACTALLRLQQPSQNSRALQMPTLPSAFPLVSVHRDPHCVPDRNLQPRSTLAVALRPFSNHACPPDFIVSLMQTAPQGLFCFNISSIILPTPPPVRYNQLLNTHHGVSEKLRTPYYSHSGKWTFTSGKGSPEVL